MGYKLGMDMYQKSVIYQVMLFIDIDSLHIHTWIFWKVTLGSCFSNIPVLILRYSKFFYIFYFVINSSRFIKYFPMKQIPLAHYESLGICFFGITISINFLSKWWYLGNILEYLFSKATYRVYIYIWGNLLW